MNIINRIEELQFQLDQAELEFQDLDLRTERDQWFKLTHQIDTLRAQIKANSQLLREMQQEEKRLGSK